jgi:phosphate transport system substrate-binding protein
MKNLIIILLVPLLFVSCNQNPGSGYSETATRGNIKIGVDESFKLLIDSEIFVFSALYKYANITPLYKTEYEVIEDFMNDSVRTIVTSRLLTQNQVDYLRGISIIPKTDTIAIDAVAFVVNRANPDSLIQIHKIKQVMMGVINNWSDINKKINQEKSKLFLTVINLPMHGILWNDSI